MRVDGCKTRNRYAVSLADPSARIHQLGRIVHSPNHVSPKLLRSFAPFLSKRFSAILPCRRKPLFFTAVEQTDEQAAPTNDSTPLF